MSDHPEIETTSPLDPSDKRLGNMWWKARSTHGRTPKYTDPRDLESAIDQYYEHVVSTPIWSSKAMVEDKVIRDVPVSHMRIMTIEGCARYCGISYETWTQYKKKEGFSDVIKEAEQVIREYKLGGAASGLLNANIIARDIQLRDNVAVVTEVTVLSQDERLQKLKDMQT